MSKVLFISALISLALCNIYLNIKYKSFIDGDTSFNLVIAKKIYSDYYSPYTVKSDGRFKIFIATLI